MDSKRILAAFGFREGKNKACMEKALAGNWADVIRTMQADNCSPRKAAKVLGYDPSLVLGAMISHPETAQAITAVIWLRHDVQHLAPVYQGIVDKYLAERGQVENAARRAPRLENPPSHAAFSTCK